MPSSDYKVENARVSITLLKQCQRLAPIPSFKIQRSVLHFSDAFRQQEWITERGTSSARWWVQIPPSAIFFDHGMPSSEELYQHSHIAVKYTSYHSLHKWPERAVRALLPYKKKKPIYPNTDDQIQATYSNIISLYLYILQSKLFQLPRQ